MSRLRQKLMCVTISLVAWTNAVVVYASGGVHTWSASESPVMDAVTAPVLATPTPSASSTVHTNFETYVGMLVQTAKTTSLFTLSSTQPLQTPSVSSANVPIAILLTHGMIELSGAKPSIAAGTLNSDFTLQSVDAPWSWVHLWAAQGAGGLISLVNGVPVWIPVSTNDGQSNRSSDSTSAHSSVYYTASHGQLYKHLPTGFAYVIGPAAPFMQSGATYTALGNQYYVLDGNAQGPYAGTFENPFRTMDLRQPTGLSLAQLQAYIASTQSASPLLRLCKVFLQAQNQYGVNAQYLLAHAIIESAWGFSKIAHDKDNLFGYGAFDSTPYASAATFPSMSYAILYQAWFVRKNYLDPSGAYFHGSNLDGMNQAYATDQNWAESIAAMMWNMQAGRPLENPNPPTLLPKQQGPPVFSYTPGVVGKVTGNQVNIRTNPDLQSSILGEANKGSLLKLTGWLPGWYQISLPAHTQAYISSAYVSPQNLGKVTGTGVNVRAGPTLSSSTKMVASYGKQCIVLGLSKDKQWYHVRMMNGVEGYVFGQFLTYLS